MASTQTHKHTHIHTCTHIHSHTYHHHLSFPFVPGSALLTHLPTLSLTVKWLGLACQMMFARGASEGHEALRVCLHAIGFFLLHVGRGVWGSPSFLGDITWSTQIYALPWCLCLRLNQSTFLVTLIGAESGKDASHMWPSHKIHTSFLMFLLIFFIHSCAFSCVFPFPNLVHGGFW